LSSSRWSRRCASDPARSRCPPCIDGADADDSAEVEIPTRSSFSARCFWGRTHPAALSWPGGEGPVGLHSHADWLRFGYPDGHEDACPTCLSICK
jgi:hypothetical protein